MGWKSRRKKKSLTHPLFLPVPRIVYRVLHHKISGRLSLGLVKFFVKCYRKRVRAYDKLSLAYNPRRILYTSYKQGSAALDSVFYISVFCAQIIISGWETFHWGTKLAYMDAEFKKPKCKYIYDVFIPYLPRHMKSCTIYFNILKV
jgi:hypothetical protein